MNRALEAAYKEFNAQHEGWDLHMPAGGDWIAPDSHYYTTAAVDGREEVDYRPAVSEPSGLPDLPSELASRAKKARGVEYVPFASVAPAPLHDPSAIEERRAGDERQDAIDAHAEAIRARALREYAGDYPEVLTLLMQRKTLGEIAAATGYTERHVRNVVRGNAQRPEAGSLNAWLEGFLRSVWQGDVPISVEPVKTGKKNRQFQAVVAQMAWDFEAIAMGVMV